MSAQTKTYPMPDPAAVAAKIEALGGPAIDTAQTSGKAETDGVTIDWTIANDLITITIARKPWIVPYSAIWEHVGTVLGAPTA